MLLDKQVKLEKALTEHYNLEQWLKWKEYLSRFLVCMTLLTAAWVAHRGANAEWWGMHGFPNVGLLKQWGPFRIQMYGPNSTETGFGW